MCESNGDPHVLDELLSDSNCNVNAYDAKGYAMIHRAASFGYSACIDMLIRYGADINLKTLSNLTVAEVAANAGFDGTKDWVEMTCKLCNVSVDCSGDGAGLFRRNHE